MTENVPVIREINARAVDVPMARPIKAAVGEILSAPLVLIDVATDAGVTGHSYVFSYTSLALKPLTQLANDAGALLVGRTLAPRERAADFVRQFRLLGRQGLLGMALSGIDMALWDAFARTQDQPLATVLGGTVRPLPAYDSYGAIDLRQDRAALEATLDQGFRAIKVKLGLSDLDLDVTTVAGLRDLVGDQVRLMVDYNQSLTVAEAIRRTEALARYDIDWVEEPVPAEDLAGHAAIRAAVSVPIQTGENWWFPQDMAKAISAGAADYAMPDIMKIGGVTGWLEAMTLAQAASLPVSSHAFVEASAHMLAVTPTAHWLEFLDKARPILQEPARVVDGAVAPQGPGLGLTWDEQAVARYLA